jgi:hypothetical protein
MTNCEMNLADFLIHERRCIAQLWRLFYTISLEIATSLRHSKCWGHRRLEHVNTTTNHVDMSNLLGRSHTICFIFADANAIFWKRCGGKFKI